MNSIYQQILAYLRGIWVRRWYAIAVAWLVCAGGWTAVSSLPDRYESSARIYVDMDTMLGPLMRGMTVEMNLYQQIDIMRRTLLSRPNLEKILLMTDLDIRAKSEAEKTSLMEELKERVGIEQQGRNLFRIVYDDVERALARRVVQAVMQVFVEGNLGASRQDMDATERFLENQIRDYERQLIEAEARLAKFKQDNMGLLPGTGNYYAHMQTVTQQLRDAEARISEAVMVRDEYRAQLQDVARYIEVVDNSFSMADFGAGPRGPESDLTLRLLELEVARESLLSRYTERHPDVLAIQRQLDSVKKQLAEESAVSNPKAEQGSADAASIVASGTAGTTAPTPKKNLVPNPTYEQIKLQIVNQEGTIAALKSRAAEAKREVERWSAMAQRAPNVEAQLVQLTRDYEIIKRGYEELRQRQEAAKIARDMDTKAQKIQFRVIDPPSLPQKPSGPNRLMLNSGVLLGGIAAGLAFAFLLSQINTTFPSVHQLRSTFTLPVLGRVTKVISPVERRRHIFELTGFGAAAATLILAFVGLVGAELIGLGPAAQLVQNLGVL